MKTAAKIGTLLPQPAELGDFARVAAQIDHPDQQEQPAGGNSVVQHLVNRALHPLRVEREDAEHHEAQMADRRVGDQPLQVRLHHRDQRAVDDSDHRQRQEQRRRLDRDLRKERDRETQEAVGPHLQHHAGQDHRARGGRLGMRVGQPGVHRPHRNLDREGERESGEQPGGLAMAQRHAVEIRQIESQMAEMRARGAHQVKNRDQHQERAEHRVQDELEGGVDLRPCPQIPIRKYIGISISSQNT